MSEVPTQRVEAERVVRILAARADGETHRGPCPEPDLLVALAEGGQLQEEAPALEDHLVHCDDCRIVVQCLVEEALNASPTGNPLESATSPGIRRGLLGTLSRRWIAAAVLVVAAVGFAAFLGTGGPTPPALGTAELLAEAARKLAEADPRLFGKIKPLGPGDLEAYPVDVLRSQGAPVLLHPVSEECILLGRPTLRWMVVPGAEEHQVTVLESSGRILHRVTVLGSRGELPWPASGDSLLPGQEYQWEVSAKGPRGPVRSRSVFRVATPEESARLEESIQEIKRRVALPIGDLLLAHHLLAHRVYGAAEAAARRYGVERPDDSLGRETLRVLARITGSREDASREPPPR